MKILMQYISKDSANTFAGKYSARLAELETINILQPVRVKCPL